jgi:hypothetical protein
MKSKIDVNFLLNSSSTEPCQDPIAFNLFQRSVAKNEKFNPNSENLNPNKYTNVPLWSTDASETLSLQYDTPKKMSKFKRQDNYNYTPMDIDQQFNIGKPEIAESISEDEVEYAHIDEQLAKEAILNRINGEDAKTSPGREDKVNAYINAFNKGKESTFNISRRNY